MGRLDGISVDERQRLLARSKGDLGSYEGPAREIIAAVRARGDAALYDLTERFDGVRPKTIEVPKAEWAAAERRVPDEVRRALRYAARNIAVFHEALLPRSMTLQVGQGISAGRRAMPLSSVGCYVPGGKAAYPSTLLMTVVPARVAGVPMRVVVTPPGSDGRVSDVTLAAAKVAGATRLFSIGGVQAIAALAYGTESVPRVAKIVGPGNNYVNAAKRLVYGDVGLDSLAGPSEVVVICDDTADARLVALELLAQAEHDEAAACVALTTSARMASAVEDEVVALLKEQPRREIITKALERHGAILVAASLTDAVSFANEYAPEHVVISTKAARKVAARLTTAGAIFLGASCVAFGDYASGTNHVLPTAGSARFASGLSTSDFLRFTTWQDVRPPGSAALGAAADTLASVEGLHAHAQAARARAAPGTASARPKSRPTRRGGSRRR
ncbi:MAG: histidinol dehydrogenase [Euryarchaeota archaeon]|nr:histidinol dehydrogenase [Euryarchaeota archaeon]